MLKAQQSRSYDSVHWSHKLRSYGHHLFEPTASMGELDACARVANALFEYDGITQAKLLMSPEDSAKAIRTIAPR
jgi:hypothetical protein